MAYSLGNMKTRIKSLHPPLPPFLARLHVFGIRPGTSWGGPIDRAQVVAAKKCTARTPTGLALIDHGVRAFNVAICSAVMVSLTWRANNSASGLATVTVAEQQCVHPGLQA